MLAGAMDVLDNVDNILVEIKDAGAKHELLRSVFQTGGFNHVYGYSERYLISLRDVSSLNGTMTDLTSEFLATHSRARHDANMEDRLFTREPLPASFVA